MSELTPEETAELMRRVQGLAEQVEAIRQDIERRARREKVNAS